MPAILNKDIILKLSASEGVNIGSIPRGVGLERLRWDGEKLVDLADLNEMWVDKDGILHIIPDEKYQLIKMTYKDRKNLIKDGTQWRVKTPEELNVEVIEKERNKIYARRVQHYPNIGDQLDALLKHFDGQEKLPEELVKIIESWNQVKIDNPITESLRSK